MLEVLKNGLIKTQFEFDMSRSYSAENKSKKEVSLKQDPQNPDTPEPDNQDRETEEYLIRNYRLLSAHTIRGLGYPIDYSTKGLLKDAFQLFSDKTIYKDHHLSADNWVGLLKNAVFVEEELPGVDGEFWIDKKIEDPAQAKLIRGIKTGAINRCSVTISFDWEKSHPKMKDSLFFESLGDMVDDQEVRIIATRIEQVYEVSLVWWGADDSAKSHELNNDNHDKNLDNKKVRSAYNKTALGKSEEDKRMIYEKIKQKLKVILGKELSTDIEIEQAVESLATENVELKAEKGNLESQVVKLKKSEDFEKKIKQDLKTEVLSLGKIVEGGESSKVFERAIESASFEELEVFKTEYRAKQDKMFERHCVDCGSTNVERRSSVELNHSAVGSSSEESEPEKSNFS